MTRTERSGHPRIRINEEALREGMQIESADIPASDKIRLLDALSETGIKSIVVGSFVSPKWVPQMANVEEVIEGFTPKPGVEYTALVLNPRGAERRDAFVPKVMAPDPSLGQTRVHRCDVFTQRNTARTRDAEIAGWPAIIERALEGGATHAEISVNAIWGSNWTGESDLDDAFALLHQQYDLWTKAGILVDQIWLGDPMSWNTPSRVRIVLERVLEEFPSITTFTLHLHNARGMAPISAYVALEVLDETKQLVVDTGLGGMGGCPYCGNGRYTRMIPTEDFVHLLESEGIETGIDLTKLIETVVLAEEIVGHELWGHVSKAGPRPYTPEDTYAMDMPFVQTLEEAQHFRLGPEAYEGALSPWKAPIESEMRDAFMATAAKDAAQDTKEEQ